MKFSTELHTLTTSVTELTEFAHSEGNNVMSWIGFKHIMYLAEQALLTHFRNADLGFRRLFEDYGLLIEVVSNQGRILHALKLDEEVRITVKPDARAASCLQFDITMFVERAGKPVKTYTGKIQAVLHADRSLAMPALADNYGALAPYVTSDGAGSGESVVQAAEPAPTLHWTVTIPYFYCHGNERLKMAGYLRYMEEADARFCQQQAIGVGKLLQGRRWIPAVPSAKVRILAPAFIDEVLHLEYTVREVVKTLLYTCSMNAYVERDGRRVHVATGEIVHGYAEVLSRKDWSMVNFSDDVLEAIGA
jgi:acyl-CoA thioesterase FadM